MYHDGLFQNCHKIMLYFFFWSSYFPKRCFKRIANTLYVTVYKIRKRASLTKHSNMNTSPGSSSTRASPLHQINSQSTERDANLDSTLPTVFRKSDFSYLPEFSDIINLILAGSHQDEIGKAVAQLDDRFENGRRVLQDLPGLQYVKEEQEAILKREMAVLDSKKKQLAEHLASPPFVP
ncbi:hypothetical protein CLU79DRAFT_751458 [Phycomyces nitens]|nr:hypothetical protein CLU79DRAFT_751458 [Phycomyces nitens]